MCSQIEGIVIGVLEFCFLGFQCVCCATTPSHLRILETSGSHWVPRQRTVCLRGEGARKNAVEFEGRV